jgi:membrane protease YdiL (CAAX protease family)
MVGVSTSFKDKPCKFLYIISFSISLILFLVHSIYYAYFKNFFDFSSLQYASEASEYLVDSIKNSPKWVFIITSGIVFGLLHVITSFDYLYDLLYIIPYSSLGIAFALIYYRTNNVFSSIFVHALHNTILVILNIFLIGVIL